MFRRSLLSVLSVMLIASPASAQTAEEPVSGPRISLLSPSATYNPDGDPTGASSAPGVSDRPDGVDNLYRIAAWTADVSDAVVVAGLERGDEEVPIGEMTPSDAAPDTWELLWDVPDEIPAGTATLTVNVKKGDAVVASDEVDVRLSHRAAEGLTLTDAPPDQSVSVTWPAMGGPLGFYRKSGGTWSTVVDGSTSEGTRRVQAFYSTTVPGGAPEFAFCGELPTQVGTEPFGVQIPCVLQGEHKPKEVTAVGLVAEAALDEGGHTASQGMTQESADVVRAIGRVQSVRTMSVDMSKFGRALGGQCITMTVSVEDVDGRPVQGANVDVHFKGPEGAGFATGSQNSGSKAPDEGEHETVPAMNCAGTAGGEQGSHPPAGGDTRPTLHRESTDGSGLSGPAEIGPGRWRFDLFSPVVGFGDITAWLDESRSGDRTDDDVIGKRETTATTRAQWMPVAPTIRLDPVDGGASTTGGCVPFLARVRAGEAAVPGIDINVEASGPAAASSFCEPEGSGSLAHVERAPDPDQVDPIAVVESQTDERGNLIFGLTSSAGGETAVGAWIDGESGQDDDVRASSEPTSFTSFSWSSEPKDVRLSFIDPSPYGSGSAGAGSGVQVPEVGKITVAVRASVPDLVDELDLLISSNGGQDFYEVGTLQREGATDVFTHLWSGRLARGSHVLRARVPATDAMTDLSIQAGPPAQAAEVSSRPLETTELSSPTLGSRAPFREGATAVAGMASPGAEGVDLFYTRASGVTTPPAAGWEFCGFVDLDGLGRDKQSFEGSCTLAETDKPWEVTGIAAIAVDCSLVDGCDASQTTAGLTGRGADKDSGDAVRVYGYEAGPVFSLEGPTEVPAGRCTPVTVIATDVSGAGIPAQTVDIHLEGQKIAFCDDDTRSSAARSSRRANITTLIDGTAVVGVTSKRSKPGEVSAWFDADGDGSPDPNPTPTPPPP